MMQDINAMRIGLRGGVGTEDAGSKGFTNHSDNNNNNNNMGNKVNHANYPQTPAQPSSSQMSSGGASDTVKIRISDILQPVTETLMRRVFDSVGVTLRQIKIEPSSNANETYALAQFADNYAAERVMTNLNNRNIFNDGNKMTMHYARWPISIPAPVNNHTPTNHLHMPGQGTAAVQAVLSSPYMNAMYPPPAHSNDVAPQTPDSGAQASPAASGPHAASAGMMPGYPHAASAMTAGGHAANMMMLMGVPTGHTAHTPYPGSGQEANHNHAAVHPSFLLSQASQQGPAHPGMTSSSSPALPASGGMNNGVDGSLDPAYQTTLPSMPQPYAAHTPPAMTNYSASSSSSSSRVPYAPTGASSTMMMPMPDMSMGMAVGYATAPMYTATPLQMTSAAHGHGHGQGQGQQQQQQQQQMYASYYNTPDGGGSYTMRGRGAGTMSMNSSSVTMGRGRGRGRGGGERNCASHSQHHRGRGAMGAGSGYARGSNAGSYAASPPYGDPAAAATGMMGVFNPMGMMGGSGGMMLPLPLPPPPPHMSHTGAEGAAVDARNAPTPYLGITAAAESQPLQTFFTIFEAFGGVLYIRRNHKNKEILTVKMFSVTDADNVVKYLQRVPFAGRTLSAKRFSTFMERQRCTDDADPTSLETTQFDFTASQHRSPAQRSVCAPSNRVRITGCGGYSEADLMTYFSGKGFFPELIARDETMDTAFVVQLENVETAVNMLVVCQGDVCGEPKSNVIFIDAGAESQGDANSSNNTDAAACN